ncbi:MAG: amidohydrolase family protein [Spirochaetaceae bacterium]|jgi:hydroxyatrazine ethylaminohydrolase|nr:amidohydrolase family protein [Spirochaetaceae bacterium]
MKTIIKNAASIVTCDGADRVYTKADILVTDGVIAGIGPALEGTGCEILDGSGKFVYPGLINTHHHFFQTFVRNLVKIDFVNLTLIQWLDEIYRIFAQIDSDTIYWSSIIAMADLLKHGCTTAFDHQYCFTKKTGKSPVDRQMEAARLLGIRYHAGRGCNTLPRSEGSTIPEEMRETTDEFLADCDRLIDAYHDPRPFAMTRIVAAPCQPVNCHRDTFLEAAQLARARSAAFGVPGSVRLHTHLSEGEDQTMLDRWGKRTLDWAEETGFVGPDVWYAHGWDITPDQFAAMSRTGTGVAHCPTAAALGGSPILDIPAMTRAGITVSLGCDGSATNDSSNLLDALRLSYMLQCLHSKSRGGSPSPYDMLKVATVNGARTLGRGDLGSLEVGKGADLFMVDTGTLEFAGTLHDPRNLLARVGCTAPVWLTMVAGKVVWRDGEFPGLDERDLAARAEAHCTRALRDGFPAVYH